ncbi:MAG TPA: response regulator transcription factor [Gemmatimonadaceae bacterium]|nr:response regulator transcription factor [Gemmatimonadaceae bacterium]
MTHILVIEDNHTIAEGLRRNLEIEGYAVAVAHDGIEGMRVIESAPVDLVILDLMLPKQDGFQVLREMRGMGSAIPVLILSARGTEVDKIRGFRLGADDYVVKPFGLMELLARIDALLRRARGVAPGIHDTAPPIRFGDIEVQRGEHRVLRGGAVVDLRPREYDLLMALLDRHGNAVTRIALLREVWGYADNVVTRTVDTHIAALRQRLEADPARPRHILTVRKVGYRVALEQPADR